MDILRNRLLHKFNLIFSISWTISPCTCCKWVFTHSREYYCVFKLKTRGMMASPYSTLVKIEMWQVVKCFHPVEHQFLHVVVTICTTFHITRVHVETPILGTFHITRDHNGSCHTMQKFTEHMSFWHVLIVSKFQLCSRLHLQKSFCTKLTLHVFGLTFVALHKIDFTRVLLYTFQAVENWLYTCSISHVSHYTRSICTCPVWNVLYCTRAILQMYRVLYKTDFEWVPFHTFHTVRNQFPTCRVSHVPYCKTRL